MNITIATHKGHAPITGVETRTVGRQRRFALTRHAAATGMTGWTITHVPTGCAMLNGVVSPMLPRTLKALSAVVRAWDSLDGMDWSVIDALPHAGKLNLKRDRDRITELRLRLRAAADATLTH